MPKKDGAYKTVPNEVLVDTWERAESIDSVRKALKDMGYGDVPEGLIQSRISGLRAKLKALSKGSMILKTFSRKSRNDYAAILQAAVTARAETAQENMA